MPEPDQPRLTHLDAAGRARMVDVGDKPTTQRGAIAEGHVRVSAELASAIAANAVAKGNVLEVARLAGVQAAKRTAEGGDAGEALGERAADVSDTHLALRTAPRAEGSGRGGGLNNRQHKTKEE